MGRIVFAALTPRAPVLIERIGGRGTRQVSGTVQALGILRARIEQNKPDPSWR